MNSHESVKLFGAHSSQPWFNWHLGLLVALVLWLAATGARGTNIIWSEPVQIADDSDIITGGELERACNFGAAEPVAIVSGVPFKMFGANAEAAGGSLSDGKTTLLVSGDGDALAFESAALLNNAAGVSASYGALLRSAVYNRGSSLAVVLHGLSAGKTYFVQLWVHDSRGVPTSLVFSGGTNISAAIKLNATETAAGRGNYLVGVFTADAPDQVMTCTPLGGAAQINALQARIAPEDQGLITLKQPESVTNSLFRAASLTALAVSKTTVNYRWQRLTDGKAVDLADNPRISGANTRALNISSLRVEDAGSYQVVMKDDARSVCSRVATLVVLEPQTNLLINVAINSGSTALYKGSAVLAGTADDRWNSIDGRQAFTNIPLMDAAGAETPVTLTLAKTNGGAVRNGLLGAVSFATGQVVTLSNLPPNEMFRLVVFSVGNMANEGGAFTGAVEGLCRGYPEANTPATGFNHGINYIENPYARSDAQGVLAIRIAPTMMVMAGGYTNCDFNGLQLMKTMPGPPVILQPPEEAKTYPGRALSLTVLAASPPSLPVSYQWQRLTASSTNEVADGDGVSGATTSRLSFSSITPRHAGSYRVVIVNELGTTASQPAAVSVLTNQLINVAINNGSLPARVGTAVIEGTPTDIWNSIDARTAVTNQVLLDSTGAATPVTLTLARTNGGAVLNKLLGAVSFGTTQTVTLSNLPPHENFRLVVFSVGNMANEGGVFSGAIEGICRGYPAANMPATRFIPGTNYLESPYLATDARGTFSFTIKPNATVMPGGHFFGDFNGLQLLRAPPGPPVIVQQPASVKVFAGRPVNLNVQARGPTGAEILSYRWQRVSAGGTNDLGGKANIAGATTGYLAIRSLTAGDVGGYRVLVSNPLGCVTSAVAKVSMISRQLINVAVNNGNSPAYAGKAVLEGQPGDVWNSVDARKAFAGSPLVDSEGAATPVTLTLTKTNGGAVLNKLLGAVSFGTTQTVTISNLPPNEKYHLVVFSVGNMANEGGVFSGAIEGMCEGYPAANTPATSFVSGVNYVENPEVVSDARGIIAFTIKANATTKPGGHFFGDLNGLQLLRTAGAASFGRAAAQ